MSSSKAYLDYVLDQLSGLEGINCRAMMGEYILYSHGKIFGGVYDYRLLVKPTKAALSMLPTAAREKPDEGAKELLLVEDVDDRSFLEALISAMDRELPPPKKRK